MRMTATNNTIMCDLSHLGLLEISGADAMTFLQGQVTNDVKLLTGNNAHYSAYCNPKGRMLALFLAFAHADHIHLQLNRELVDPILKRLKMYVMRSKVEIKDVSESIIKFGINGLEASQILASSLAKIPTQDYELITLDNATVLKLPSTCGARFEIFTDVTNAPIIWDALKAKCKVVEKLYWDLLEIQAGIPDIELKTQEQFVPQMLNLDILNGINFKKGCYTGQEIVARTHYLGSVKRRTYLAEICPASQFASAPQAGDKILDATQNEVGLLVRVAPNLDNGFDVLAEMRIDAQQTGEIYWNKVILKTKELPYSLDV
jgi:folate-binding protein YgfZ